jgi:hypothetical protein
MGFCDMFEFFFFGAFLGSLYVCLVFLCFDEDDFCF